MGIGLSAGFFYDSYAVLAYASGHHGYKKYFEDSDGILTKLNLLEIYYRSLEVHGSKVALNIAETFSKYLMDFGLKEIADSMKLRLEFKREGKNLSYADALGYSLSRKKGLRFLTGDRAFKGLDGVEYLE
jgi:predicted nucleic acid-binding protein